MKGKALASFAVLAFAGAASASQVTVGAGSTLDLGTGSLDLGCADFNVGGTFSAGTSGVSQARHLSIASGGVLNGDSATIEIAGDWSNGGTFIAGTGGVAFVDGCGSSSSTITGANTFHDLALTTTGGKQVFLEHGVTQTVAGTFSVDGAPGNLLVLRSTLGGSAAFLDAQGPAGGDYVDVEDVGASTGGGEIILGLNSLVGGNAPGWSLVAVPVPALPLLGLVALGTSLFAAGLWAQRSEFLPRSGA